jgi:hypothetical protein
MLAMRRGMMTRMAMGPRGQGSAMMGMGPGMGQGKPAPAASDHMH